MMKKWRKKKALPQPRIEETTTVRELGATMGRMTGEQIQAMASDGEKYGFTVRYVDNYPISFIRSE
jgi:hypothetical protein